MVLRLYIYIWKTKFTSYKRYFFVLAFSKNAKKTDADQSILKDFLFQSRLTNVSQTFQSSRRKRVFPKCAYHWYNLLRWMFFIPCDNSKQYFFTQTYCYSEAWCNCHAAAFFRTSVLKEVHILYPLSPHKYYDDANSKGSKWSFYFLNFLKKSVCW